MTYQLKQVQRRQSFVHISSARRGTFSALSFCDGNLEHRNLPKSLMEFVENL